jgi:Thioredoxin like C-terminal domain
VTGTGDEAPADWDQLQSVDTYLGYQRAEGFASADEATWEAQRRYAAPLYLPRNSWARSGAWTIGPQHAAADEPGTSLAVRFHARDLNLVMAPADRDGPVRFRVTLGVQTPAAAYGGDVDADGAGVISEPRMYQLFRTTDVPALATTTGGD